MPYDDEMREGMCESVNPAEAVSELRMKLVERGTYTRSAHRSLPILLRPHQLDLVSPGTSPFDPISRSVIRLNPLVR